MLLDGYWKTELKRIRRSMRFWSGFRISIFDDYVEHKINQGFLYSAVIIRKISEDEKDAEKTCEKNNLPMPRLPVLKINVLLKQYNHINEDKFFMLSRVYLQDYDMNNEIVKSESLYNVCNQIIHSYIWGLVYLNGKHVCGALMASDRFKDTGVFYLTINEWTDVIQKVIEEAAI